MVVGLLVATVSLSLTGCDDSSENAAEKVKVLKLAHGLDVTHPVHKGMVYMAEQVAKKSGGTLRVEIFPNESLGNEKECIEALQLGYLAMTKTSSGPMEAFVPKLKIFGLPYLFRDSEHFWKVCLGPIGKELLEAGVTKRLKGLCYYDAGARSFYAKQPINTPADLKKNEKNETMKVRVMNSPMAMGMISTMGGAPTSISWGELYTSLDQGVVDAAENNPPSFQLSRHYEICKYYILDEHVMVPDMLIISTRVWEKLSDEHKKILKEAVDESVTEQRKLWIEAEKKAMEVVKADGVTIIIPDKAPFREAVKPMWDEYEESLGDLARKIKEVK
ncbi:MAG: TRAP transporter substrate-binding protein [Phycisphaerae bacterium]|nr:TRAP transporter substrate-binding protein [Phycisphaerae bacterium]